MLKERSTQQEIMDDLSISGKVVAQTLKELNLINRRLGGNQISLAALKKMIAHEKEVAVADLGCGGGDIMVDMAKWTRKKGIEGHFTGIDANQHIIEYAQENTQAFPEIAYQAINIFSEEFKKQEFDVIHCCLFLHHFTNEELIDLFRQFSNQARVGVIVNDLHRHAIAYWSIYGLTSLFSRSSMVKNDAAVSVARGFKRNDLKKILESAGISKYQLSWKWAFRWKLCYPAASDQK